MKQKKVLVFQHSWLEKYGWLVYSPAAGSGLCKYCTLFASKNDKRKYVGVLVSKPFVNLVKAAGKDGVLENHQNHQYHKDAVQRGLLLVQHQKTPGSSMPYLISQANRQVYQKNIHILKSVVEAVVLCGKQSLPIRGHRDDRSSISSNKGNFLAIIDLMAKHDSTLGSKTHNTHRKPFRIRSKQNTRSLDDENAFFSIMADEVTDPHGNQEILSICLRTLTGCKISEFVFDFVHLKRTTGESIAHTIIHSVNSNKIYISKVSGQSYDGAQCMSSEKVGVQAKIKQLTSRALYIHCNSHVLNLSIANACKLPPIRNMIDTLNAVFLFFDMSPKRQRFLERVLQQLAPDIRKKKLVGICKTRWIERHTCYDCFYEMY